MQKLIRSGAPLMVITFAIALLAGCSGSDDTTMATDIDRFDDELAQKEQELVTLRSQIQDQSQRIESLEGDLMTAQQAREQAYANMDDAERSDSYGSGDLFPPAKPGECYTRVFVPAQYEQVTEQVLHKAASSTIKTVPARYEWTEEQVVVEPASYRLEAVPARYEWQEERIMVREARTEWKRGRGPVEKVDSTTGEIMCLVEVPAQYKTVRKQVEVEPATTRRVEIAAKYDTVKIRKVVEEAREVRTEIPAEYQTLTRWRKVSDGHMDWREIICETNLGSGIIERTQRALKAAGHNPGPIDGVIGSQTMDALRAYQRSKSLAVGDLTFETLQSLGVTVK